MAMPLMPPDELIIANGIGVTGTRSISEEFDEIGHGLIKEMTSGGFIQPDSVILDVGCGLGRLARALVGILDPSGSYYGMDVNRTSIDWCQESYSHITNFHFVHADVFSTSYNKTGKQSAKDYTFPFGNNEFDFILSTSLFTHLMIESVDRYLGQMARVLKLGGQIWNTYFLLDDISDPLASTFDPDRPNVFMPHVVNGGRIALKDNPEALTGLSSLSIKQIHAKHGLEIVEIRNGPWSGRTDNLKASYQDVILARKIVARDSSSIPFPISAKDRFRELWSRLRRSRG